MKVGTQVVILYRSLTKLGLIVGETKTQWLVLEQRVRVFENGDVDLTELDTKLRFSKNGGKLVGNADTHYTVRIREPLRQEASNIIDKHHVEGMARFLSTRRWEKMSKESLKLVMLVVKEHTK